MRDEERIERVRRALEEAQLDALVCALPIHVLLLTGYWPVVGLSLAIATREGRIVTLIPADEKEFAQQGWADEIHTFEPVSLSELQPTEAVVEKQWEQLARHLGITHARIGYEAGPVSEPAPYVALNLYGPSLVLILHQGFPGARLVPVNEMLLRLTAVKTPGEVDSIRAACQITEQAFAVGQQQLRPGLKETEAASLFRRPLSNAPPAENQNASRADGFAFCMSGPNAAKASGAYARSRDKEIADGELVLVHCNSYLNGYWTDVTRTYSTGAPDAQRRELYDAVFAAREASLAAIQPGATAGEVDQAARETLKARGFVKEFKHPTGHGIGFAAIAPNARPQIHPKSQEVLETGMVFNLEPAIYIDNYGGLRHCDMVAVTESGYELLTPFQEQLEQLICH